MLDIIGIGDSNVDLIISVDHLPSHDEKVRGRLIGKFPGGIIGNFCCAAAKFGATTGVVTKIGEDEYGDICLRDFKERGLNVDAMVIKSGAETYYCIIHLDHTGEKALTIIETSAFLPLKEEINLDYVRNARYVHMTSLDMELTNYVFENLKDSGCQFSLDIEATASSTDPSTWRSVLQHLDIAFPNESGLQALTKQSDIEKGAKILLDYGVKMVVVTCGADGVKIFQKDDQYEHPGYQVEVKDTTGAGDCFNAVFLSCMSKGWASEKAAKYATAAAAISIQYVGARSGLPTYEEVERFLLGQGESL